MKKILVSMFAVAALAACTSEQTIVAPQNEAIGFDTFVDNSTRAEDITTDNIADFGVYGTVTKGGNSALIFDNTEVTGSKNSGYTYSPAQYWIAAAKYDFLAFAPYAERQWTYTPEGQDGQKGQEAQNGTFSFNNATAEADQDVVYAYKTKTTADKLNANNTQAVEFTFKHILSKVAFSFTNTFTDDNTSLNVYNVKINNTAKTGTMAIEAGADDAWEVAGDLVVPFGAEAANADDALANGAELKLAHHYVIPAERMYNITFSVDLYQAGVYLATYNHTIESTINFAKNGNYVLSVKLAPETIDPDNELYPIEFTVNEVEDWRDNGSVALTEPVEVATEAELKAAIAAGENVKLTADITLDEPLQITKNAIVDLNRKNISVGAFTESNGTISAGNTDSFAFWVKNGGELTINGEGTVSTADCKYSIAVWAQGGKVTINGGKFTNAGEGSDLIYASANGHVVINGGEFVACKKDAGVDGTNQDYSVLNLKGDNTGSSITCYGGRYFKFDPANNKSENPAVSFVAPGYESVVDGDYFKVVKK